jgi:hypothetical protein
MNRVYNLYIRAGRNADLRVCDQAQDVQRFLSVTADLGLQAANLNMLKNVTNCKNKCSYIQYTATPL